MSERFVRNGICPHCSASVVVDVSCCPACGGSLEAVDRRAPENTNASTSVRQLVDNRWAVLAVLFFVAAGFALPILWVSRAFSPLAKIVLTIVILAYTAALIWCIVVMGHYIFTTFRQLFA